MIQHGVNNFDRIDIGSSNRKHSQVVNFGQMTAGNGSRIFSMRFGLPSWWFQSPLKFIIPNLKIKQI
jgi:hypothetical protein